jgi:hypothetical protein
VQLIAEISEAFRLEPVPTEPLLEAEYLNPAAQGDEGATEYFSGKRWDSLDVRNLRCHAIALYMFTPEAHRYYLPAFMKASLEYPAEADVIPENILFHFAEFENPFWAERIRALSPLQRQVVAGFLRATADRTVDERWLVPALRGLALGGQMPNKSLERTREG